MSAIGCVIIMKLIILLKKKGYFNFLFTTCRNMAVAGIEIKTVAGGDCFEGYKQGAILGSGEQGTAYRVAKNTNGSNANERLVMKISKLDTKYNVNGDVEKTKAQVIEDWKNEAQTSHTLGEAGIGPKIYKVWLCNNGGNTEGYIVMQKMKYALRNYPGAFSTYKNADGIDRQKDTLNAVPLNIQKDYVTCLEKMIDRGYIHMDNHPGNLGITEVGGVEKGILFDFGFTQKRDDLGSLQAKLYALGFSIAQIIEHTPLVERRTNYLYKILIAIEQEKYVWGSGDYKDAKVNTFTTKYKTANAHEEKLLDVLGEPVPAGVPKDVYVGFKLYCYLLTQNAIAMYNRANYEHVYDIRTKSGNYAGGKRRTQRRRANKRRQSRKH